MPNPPQPTSFLQELRGPFISTVFAVIQAVALGLFAFYLKDRVDADLKERAQTVSSIKEMQSVLDAMKASTQANDRAENIVRLAMFGKDAIPVLINLSASDTKYDQNSMFDALNLLLVDHAASVCDGMRAVLARRALFDSVRMGGVERYQAGNCSKSTP